MLKREWQKIFKNKWMIVILLAIITIPAVYTSVFLGSMWDPYGDMDELPVAVVNHDRKITYEGQELAVGDALADNLKKSGSLDFHFVSDKKAEDGLKDGTYYMIISIPKDFSKNAATLMDENPKQMKLIYKTNPGTNYIASKMDDSAMAKIEKSVSEQVTETYAETIFAQIKKAGSGMAQAADGAAQVKDGARALSDGNTKIEKNLEKLASSSLVFQNGADTLKVGLKQYTDGVETAASGADALEAGAGQLQNGAASLQDGAGQLQSGSQSLVSGISQYTGGVSQAAAGTGTIAAGGSQLNQGVQELSSGTQELKKAAGQVLDGAREMSSQLDQTMPSQGQIDQMTKGMEKLNQGIQALNQAVSQADSAGSSADGGSRSEETAQKAASARTDTKQLQEKIRQLKQSSVFKSLSQEEQDQLMSEIGEVETAASDVRDDVDAVYSSAEQAGDSSGSASSGALISQLKQQTAALAQSSAQLLPQSGTAVRQMYSGLQKIQNGLGRTGTEASDMGLIQGLETMEKGIESLQNGIDGTSGLKKGIKTYTSAVSQVNEGLGTLQSRSGALNSGAAQLNQGISRVRGSLPVFVSGMDQMYQGTKDLGSGLQTLVSNNQTLNSGAAQLSAGAGQIGSGAGQLAAGSKTLGTGIDKLTDGSMTLSDSLKDGADQINQTKTSQKTDQMMASPVKTENVEYSHVQNNGHAMAPYMMSVGLFVACIAFTVMYPLMEKNEEVKNGLQWWLSKAGVMTVIAILQAVVMVGVLMGINGMHPNYTGRTFGMAVLVSMAFMAMICFFEMLINRIGSYLVLVFMVLQLGAAAGTYPLDMAPEFYKVLHGFMPFTYAVHAFRHTLSMDGAIGQDVAVFAGILIVFTVLTILLYRFRMKKRIGGTLEIV